MSNPENAFQRVLREEIDRAVASSFAYEARMVRYWQFMSSAPGPLPGPEPHDDEDEGDEAETRCTCGAQLMGQAAVSRLRCGDCYSAYFSTGRPATLDERIAAGQAPARDADPTSTWGAGATPGYEWP